MKRSTSQDGHDPAGLLAAFSGLVWDINRLARERSLANFHAAVLEQLRDMIAFDKAWWGRSALVDGHIEVHSCHLFDLPDAYVTDWRSVEEDDVTVQWAHRVPGQAIIVDLQATTPGLKWLGDRYGIGELLFVMQINPRTRLSDHLSLYRPPGAERFDDRDRLLLTQLIAHLSEAVDASQIRTLVARRERLERQQSLALAVCDPMGVLHSVERGFATLLAREWPAWQGSRLPAEIAPEQGYLGRLIRIESRAINDLYLLTVGERSPLDDLTERELGVARRFGQGQTYKQIARDLDIAPSTVRHHIRSIYQKLGVHDKAAVAGLLHQSPGD
ncbi:MULTISPECIES: helix-turn-helix transcriptional regulator [Modicisalibacter]|uniref:helix-turn-helix domain-containing protein n=1 Tax=Modicisalibacter TaxID=574347 RepID=UPI00100AE80C|nr:MULTISPECIES: helix-turn-helix transcriptional regulator [Halomonadaceae]MBZ9557492.1 helix-turn-helix transcriptional regulator [Modicisalibacter sp. R2A 31.J]MBZ9573842.1 helix-turn-helix transcriptional regulator [Modicisalibacter sp. MOD 31.J]